MSLFPSLTSTPQDQLDYITSNIRRSSYENFNSFVQLQNDWIELIWYDLTFTPQEICNELGSDAVRFFHLTNDLRQLVVAAAADNGVPSNVIYPLSAFSLSGDVVSIFNSPYVGP